MEGFFFVWFLLSLGIAWLASARGRSGVGWFFLSILISPLLCLIILLVAADLRVLAAREEDRRRDHERELESIKVLAAAPAAAIARMPATPTRSVADEVAKLAALRDSGALTEAEFIAQKAIVLARS